jgi:hypothetical protein
MVQHKAGSTPWHGWLREAASALSLLPIVCNHSFSSPLGLKSPLVLAIASSRSLSSLERHPYDPYAAPLSLTAQYTARNALSCRPTRPQHAHRQTLLTRRFLLHPRRSMFSVNVAYVLVRFVRSVQPSLPFGCHVDRTGTASAAGNGDPDTSALKSSSSVFYCYHDDG